MADGGDGRISESALRPAHQRREAGALLIRPEEFAEGVFEMSRYLLRINDRSIAVFDAPNWHRADALIRSSDLAATPKDTYSHGRSLWDPLHQPNFLSAGAAEEGRWQAQRRAIRIELGSYDGQGLFLWLISVDGEASPWFMMRDDWGLW